MHLKTFARAGVASLVAVLLSTNASAADLVVPGSGNPEYVLGVLAAAFNTSQKEHQVTVPTSTGTAGAIRDVLAGTAVLGRVGRPLQEAERSKGLTYYPVGRDAVVFVAGARVTAKSVTTRQMIDVYTGKFTDWQQVGGQAGPIRVVGRENSDASRQAIAAHIPAFADIAFGPGVKVVHLDPHMITLLDRFDTSLGMMNRSALLAAKTKVVPLALDGVQPTPENLASGRYQIALDFGLIYKSGASLPPEARAFMRFLNSAEGARILRAHGVLPLGKSD